MLHDSHLDTDLPPNPTEGTEITKSMMVGGISFDLNPTGEIAGDIIEIITRAPVLESQEYQGEGSDIPYLHTPTGDWKRPTLKEFKDELAQFPLQNGSELAGKNYQRDKHIIQLFFDVVMSACYMKIFLRKNKKKTP